MSSLNAQYIEKREAYKAELQRLADAYNAKSDEINVSSQERNEIAAQFEQQKGALACINTLISEAESATEAEVCSAEVQSN